MNKLLTTIFSLMTIDSGSSFLSMGLGWKFFWRVIGNFFTKIWNFIQGALWAIIKWILGVLEALEYIINQFLGIGFTVDDYYAFAKNTEFFNSLVKTFRAICGVGVVLLIIFTIIAIIKQEYQNAVSGMTPDGNNKTPIIINLLKKLVSMIALPIMMIFIITGVNSILTSFSRALKGEVNMTVAAQVLAASSYDANKYRKYANEDKRIPIIIQAYDASNYGSDQAAQLTYKIQSPDIQTKLLNTATMMTNGSYLSFKDSLIYKNNKLSNSAQFGDYYESFVCTAEQYQVMADFVDYAEKTGLTYYIKTVDDENVEWKYVDSSIYDESNNTLTINYRDASDINNNNNKNDSYTIQYAMSYKMSSPISDALDSILAMLGVGDYSDNLYKVMERDENSTNIVQWANDKVLIKLSEGFSLTDQTTWKESDQIIMYEYYRYPANNTFGGVSLETMMTTGVELDAKQIVYRDYYPEADAYSPEKIVKVVDINNNYYQIEQSNSLRDNYGNKYYVLKTIIGETDPSGKPFENVFLEYDYKTIEKKVEINPDTGVAIKNPDGSVKYQMATLKLSDGFDLNTIDDKLMLDWTYSDQIIMYEYYKDLSSSNMFYTYSIEDFKTGVEVPVYTIATYTYNINDNTYVVDSKDFVLINGTYYRVDASYNLYDKVGEKFLRHALTSDTMFYNYKVEILDETNRFGVTTTADYNADSLVLNKDQLQVFMYPPGHPSAGTVFTYDVAEIHEFMTEEEKEKIKAAQAYTLKFSENFDYRNTDTWTYKDYFIFYLYSKHPSIAGSGGLQTLKHTGVTGELGITGISGGSASDTRLVLKVDVEKIPTSVDGLFYFKYEEIYLEMEKVMNLSEELMFQSLNVEETIFNNHVDTLSENLFYTLNSFANSQLTAGAIESRQFYHSNSFSEINIQSWTVEDLILYLLSTKGIIDETSTIYSNGYSAQVYQILNGDNEVVDVLYRFGKPWSVDTADKTFFLSEQSILNSKSFSGAPLTANVDAWLSSNATDFIARKLGVVLGGLITDNEGIVGNMFADYSSNIYSTYAIIRKITEEYVLNAITKTDAIELYSDIVPTTYERANPDAFDAKDISTWTQLDFILYALTGDVYNTYSSNILIDESGKKYFVIKDKAIQLSGDYATTIVNDSKILSKKFDFGKNSFTELKAVTDYDSLVVEGNEISTTNLTHYLNTTFSYSSKVSVVGTDGLSDKEELTVFDVILARYTNSLDGGSYELFTDGDEIYLMLKNKTEAPTENGIYVKLSLNPNDNVSFNKKISMKLTTEKNAFVKNGTIKLFENENNYVTDKTIATGDAKFSDLESIVFNITENSELVELDVFKSSADSNLYIVVDDYYINITGVSTAEKTVESKNIDLITHANVLQQYLYDNYYESLIQDKVSGFMVGDEYNYDVEINTGYAPGDISTWTPIAIILEVLGFDPSSVVYGQMRIKENVYTGVHENYLYISQNNAELEGKLEEHYIYINDICDIIPPNTEDNTGDTAIIKSKRNVTYENILRLVQIQVSNVGGEDVASLDVSGYLTFNTWVENRFDITNVAKPVSDLKCEFASDFDSTDPSTWDWFDLVYYYYNGNFRTNKNILFETYYYSASAMYVKIPYRGKYIYMKNIAPTNFTDTETTTVPAFSNESDVEALSIIYYTLTNETSNVTLKKYKFGTALENYFYYIENKYTGEYQAVYKINETDEIGYDNSDVNSYKYTTKDISRFEEWNILDWIFAYLRGVSNSTEVSVKLTKLKNGAASEIQYLVFSNKYIRIDGFNGLGAIATLDNVNKTISSNKLIKNLIDNDADDTSNILHVYNSSSAAPDVVESALVSIESAEFEKVYFSKNFDASDFTTWQLSDFIIYYMFNQGYFDDLTYDGVTDLEDNSIKNFQQLVNQGYAPAYVCYLLSSDSSGNVLSKKVYSFSTNQNKASNGLYVNYDLFKQYYSRILTGKVFEASGNTLSISINGSHYGNNVVDGVTLDWDSLKPEMFYIEILNDLTAKDFEYKNYYYWKAKYEWLENTTIYDVPAELVTLIESGEAKYKYNINLRLSTAFNVDPVTREYFQMANNEYESQKWTLLDFIILNEYAKPSKSNVFYGVNIEDLATTDNHFVLFTNEDESIHVLAINGSYYNLTDYITGEGNEKSVAYDYLIPKDDTKEGVEEIALEGGGSVKGYRMDKFVTKGNTSEYSFKVLRAVIDLVTVKEGNSDVYETPADKNVFSFTTPISKQILTDTYLSNTTYIRTLNYNVNSAFHVDTSQYKKFTISPIVRQVNWPQKLMNDMQVLYPDLNWSTLIATDGWLDTLGEFHSAYTSGEFITSGNSSNITAAGLVLSEFFVSIAKESEMGFSKYEYTSIFDEDVIKALMLAMLGEYEYESLKMQAEIFVEMFNIAFAPILEDIAAARGINIVDGTVDNFTMSVYKSYLATVLLSSDMGEYFYKVATRVYAQYTIYESLAAASGDYSRYLAYINGDPDENGEPIKSFVYSSFYDLLVYENTVLGAVSPTFTFNYARAYKFFNPETIKTDSALRNELLSKEKYKEVFDQLYDYYEKTYERGKKVKDNEVIYCFMFDTFFSIKQTIESRGDSNLPAYLKLFNSYLRGEIKRWGMVDGISIDAGSTKVKNYTRYQIQLTILKMAAFGSIAPVVAIDNVSYDFNNNEEASNAFEAFEQALNNTSVSSPMSLLIKTMESSPKFSEDIVYIKNNIKNLLSWFTDSEEGDNDAWENIKLFSQKASGLVSELSAVCSLPVGSATENGAVKHASFTDDYYQSSLKKIRLFEQTIKSYVDTQNMLDVIVKTSITYTLSQFSQNYVADGYIFNIGNRQYTVGVSFSSSRLAEYVYGGAFLDQFGIPAQFTDEEFEGFIDISKKQDGETGMVKTKLGMWQNLRKFASEIANYTGKLYYLTNMNDLSDNIGDDILLTSNLKIADGSYTTPELLILNYLIDSDISADTLVGLIFGDTTNTLGADGLGLDPDTSDIYKLASWLEGSNIAIDDDSKRIILKQYLKLVYSTSYNTFGYYNSGNTPSDRIHLIFKKVISYLLVSEESEESSSEKAINLENLTFKQFRVLLINGIVNYKQNPTETDKENSGRYLALFSLMSTQFNYEISITGTGVIKTRTISSENLKLDTSNTDFVETMYFDGLNQYTIVVDISEDKATKDMVINLAGAENQPVENLVNLEYKDLYDMEGNYDEANGDTFIICTYDEILGKFIPVLATNIKAKFDSESPEQIKYNEYFDKYNVRVYTSYYDTAHHYPIVAKGLIDASGKPTAIRMVDYKIQFYRSNITATSEIDETAISRTSIEAVSDTVGYTNYADRSFQENGSSKKKDKAMFIADSNLSSVVKSDMSVFYLQTQEVYDLEAKDELGGMHVLDDFSVHYKLDGLSYLIMYVSLATIVPLLFKSGFQVMRRVLDLGALILIGPWAIAGSALEKPGSNSGTFKIWQGNITKSLLAAFGFVIGFNIYYIFVTLVTNMTFVSEITVLRIQNIGGFSFITQSRMNSIVSIAFILVATGSIETSANMLVSIVTGGRVSNAFESGTGDAFKEVKERIHEAIEMANKIKGVVNGEMLTQLPSAALEAAKNMIPGSGIVSKAIDFGKEKATNLEAKKMQKQAEAHGVSPALAKQAADNYKRLVNEQRQARHKKHLDTANKFTSSMGMGQVFEDAPPIFNRKPKESKKSKKDKKKKKKK